MPADIPSQKDLKRAINWVRDLPRVEDYRNGLRHTQRNLPENLVFFARNSAESLANDPHDNHHYRFILLIALEGNGSLVLNRKRVYLSTPAAVLVQPMQFHHYTGFDQKRITWLFIGFEGELFSGVQEWRSQAVPLTGTALNLVNTLGDYWALQKSDENRNLELPFVLNWLLAHFIFHSSKRIVRDRATNQDPSNKLLTTVNLWLSQHPPSEWATKCLAADCGYSLRQFHRLFLSETSIPIGQYLREQRAAFALDCIYRGDRISDVAERAGFSSIYTFSRAFKVMFGASPRQYLKKSGKVINPKIGRSRHGGG